METPAPPARRRRRPLSAFGRFALLCGTVLVSTFTTAVADEPAPDPLRGLVRKAEVRAAVLSFLEAVARADEAEQRRIAADPEVDPFLVVTVLAGAHLRASAADSVRYADAAERFARHAGAREDAKDLAGFASRLPTTSEGEGAARERRLLDLLDRVLALQDAQDWAGMRRAYEAAAEDLRDPPSPFAWLVRRRVAHASHVRDEAAREAVEHREAAKVAEALGWPRAAAESWSSAAAACATAGDREAAIDAFRREAEAQRKARRSVPEAMALQCAAYFLHTLGRPKEALETIDGAIALVPARLSEGPRREFVVLRALVLVDLGRPEEARGPLREVARAYASEKDRPALAPELANLGIALTQTGCVVEALEPFERALRLAEEGEDAGARLDALLHLGQARREVGDVRRAEELLRRAIAACREARRGSGEAAARNSLAMAFLADGRTDEARAEFEAALALHRRLGERSGAAIALGNLSDIDLGRGNARLALGEAEEALALLGGQRLKSLRVRFLTLQGLAKGRLHQDVAAAAVLRRAVAEVEATGDASPIASRALFALAANVLDRGGDPAEALALARRALALNRVAAQGFAEEEAGSRSDQARAAAELAFLAASRVASGAGLSEAFRFTESARAMVLAEGLAHREDLLRAELPEDVAKEEASSRAAVVEARRALLEALRRPGPPGEGAPAVASARKALDEAYAARERAILHAHAHARRVADVVWPEPVALADFRAALAPTEACVLWQVTAERVFAFVVRGAEVPAAPETGGAAIVEVGAPAEVERLVTGWLTLASTPDGAEEALARRLYDVLVKPLEPHLAGVLRLLLSPDGSLAFLPFDALLRGEGAAGQRLVERYEVACVPSATVYAILREARRGRPAGRGVLAVGDPRYPPGPAAVARGGFDAPRPLPGSRREVETVAATFPEADRRVLLGEDATVDGFERALGARPDPARPWRAVHLAAHAFVDASRPRLSGLLLSGGDVLDVDRAYRLRADADLVTLSACETARGKWLAGEGVLGLVRGFFFAGASRVVASSWKVSDEDARLLMEDFYRRQGAGVPPSAALRAARLARKAAAPHPYHWAAFTLWGLPD